MQRIAGRNVAAKRPCDMEWAEARAFAGIYSQAPHKGKHPNCEECGRPASEQSDCEDCYPRR